jgi:hypothetical protein
LCRERESEELCSIHEGHEEHEGKLKTSLPPTMPRIQTTRTVKIALYGLRIYLIVLLALILVKFLRIFG